MAHYRVGGGREHPRETKEYKKSRHEYSQALLQKVREPGITYRRIICFDEGPVQGKIEPGYIREWLLEHSRELLEIKKHKPGKVSLKKGTVVFGPDIFLVKNKVAVISLDIRDPISNLVHTDGTLIFHNPPDAKIIEHLYDFCMIADDGSIAVDSIPEG
jgi:hypothetical protein